MKKTCVITGATSGIGKEVAIQLAGMGYALAVIGRSQERGDDLLRELKGVDPSGKYQYYLADMSRIGDMKTVSAQIAGDYPVIDLLINNAGGVFANFELTEDGIERTIANNHLGYYISTVLLMENLKRSDDGRIIIVASDSHYKGKIDFDSFTSKKGFFITTAYAQSKLANVLFTYSLSEKMKGSGLSINVLHPGVVKTPIGTKTGSGIFTLLWKLFASWRGISTQKSAETYIYLATTDEGGEHHGKYFHDGKVKKSSQLSYDTDLAEKLWKWSEEATNVRLSS